MTYIAHLPFLPQSNVKLGICVIEKTFVFLSAMLFWYSLQPSLELGILWKTYFVRKYQFLWKITWTEDRIKDSIQFEIIFFSSTHNYGYSTDLSVLAILPWSFSLLSEAKAPFNPFSFLVRPCFSFMEQTNPQHHKFSTAVGILVFLTVFTLCTTHSN